MNCITQRMPLVCGAISFFALLFILLNVAYAQDNKVSAQFRNYRHIEIHKGSDLSIDPQLKYRIIEINKQQQDNDFKLEEYFGDKWAQIDCGKYVIYIGFSSGPSHDPNYQIVARRNKNVFLKNVLAERLAVSSNCQFYASGEADNNFYMRQKFTITEKGIEETIQPFYLVDEACRTSAAATLTTDRCGKGTVVAHLPEGSEVRILLSEGSNPAVKDLIQSTCENKKESYLVSTPFGLVGWVENKAGGLTEPGIPLSCIIYHGD